MIEDAVLANTTATNTVRFANRIAHHRLPDNMNVPQTKFTFIGRVALNGIVPHQIVDKKQPEFLTSVGTTVRKSFDKSDRIDRSRRDEFKRKLEVSEDVLVANTTATNTARLALRPLHRCTTTTPIHMKRITS